MTDDFLKPSYTGVQRLTQQLLDEAGPERTAKYILELLEQSGITTLREIATTLRISERELYNALYFLDQQQMLTYHYGGGIA